MKRITSLLLVFAILSTLSQPVLAIENPMFSMSVVGTIDTNTRFAEQSTLAVSWQIQANQPDLTLNSTQSLQLAYDNTVLQLIRWDAASAYADSSIGTLFTIQSRAGNLGVFDSDVIQVYAARNSVGDTGYVSLSVGDNGAVYTCPQGVYIPLLSVRFAFRDGKSAADLTPDSIRMMTAPELRDTSMSFGALINAYANGNPDTFTSYEYLLQQGGVPTGEDTLNAPTFSLPVNAQAAAINTQPVGGAVIVGASFNLTVEANSLDGGALSYQWYSNSSETNSGGTAIPGAANATYTAPTGASGVYHYYVVVTNTLTDNGDGGLKTAAIASNAVTLVVNDEPIYSISLSETDTYAFPAATEGYGAQTAKNIVITNTGDQPTGDLIVVLSGANTEAFTLSAANVASIAVGGTGGFSVVPNMGLAAGDYNATVTVSGGNGISAGFNVSLTVNQAPKYGISLSETGTYTFPAATFEYPAQTTRNIVITNTGNQPTGDLAIALGGADTAAFTLSVVNVASIAVDETSSFTVVPITGLGVGVYNATVTVSGSNDVSASFGVSFTVSEAPTYGISLSETGAYAFPPTLYGYPPQTARSVTIYNTGNQPTGALTIALSGADANAFLLSTTNVASIAAGGNGNFTVVPNTGLSAGEYTATVTASGGNGISASFGVIFTVNQGAPGISISETGVYLFPGATENYPEQTARNVTIQNIALIPTGDLTITLGGANANAFTLSTTNVASIAVGESSSFFVVPNIGLAVGTYNATVTVSGNNGVTASFTVSFTVTQEPRFGVTLSETGVYAFPAVDENYSARTPRTVTITNSGNQPTGALTIELSGTNANAFTLSTANVAGIAVGGNSNFTVVPNTGLAVGVYTATVTVSSDSGISASFEVSFPVTQEPRYGVTLSETGVYAFPAVDENYSARTPRTVTITNSGNQPTGALTISLSGTNANAFTLSTANVAGIAVGGSSNFTVVPNTGLAVGTYTATATVSGGNNISESFNVRFMVNPTDRVEYISFKYGDETATVIIPGNKLSIEAAFADPVDTPQTLIAALYNKRGALVVLATCDGVIDSQFISFSVDLDIPIEVEKGACVKVFVWDSQSFAPMYDAISFTDSDS